MATYLHHINLSTPDMARLQTFYEEAFGFEAIFVHNLEDFPEEEGKPGAATLVGVKDPVCSTVTMRGENCFIELFQWSSPEGNPLNPLRQYDYGYTHLCFAVDDISAEYERLLELGVEFMSPPVKTEFYNKPFGSVYARDPDGNILELMQTPSGTKLSLDSCKALQSKEPEAAA